MVNYLENYKITSKKVNELHKMFKSRENKSENIKAIEFKLGLLRVMLIDSFNPAQLKYFNYLTSQQKKLCDLTEKELIKFVLENEK